MNPKDLAIWALTAYQLKCLDEERIEDAKTLGNMVMNVVLEEPVNAPTAHQLNGRNRDE